MLSFVLSKSLKNQTHPFMKMIKVLLLIAIATFSNYSYAQQNSGIAMSNQEIVSTFLNGFNNPSQIQASLALLADDYQFTNPMVTLQSKAEFIALAKEISAVLTGVNLISTAENGEWVGAFYEFTSSVPGVESNMASEWFRLENGIIQESRLIYDASEWRKIYAQMENKIIIGWIVVG
jgi:predicted SnoaL-like aldol condensation-catalyzing enzyme